MEIVPACIENETVKRQASLFHGLGSVIMLSPRQKSSSYSIDSTSCLYIDID